MNAPLFCCLCIAWLVGGAARAFGAGPVEPSPCLALELRRPTAEGHRLHLVLTAPYKRPVNYDASLEMQLPTGEWTEVRETLLSREQPPTNGKFASPLMPLLGHRHTLVLSYPPKLSRQYAHYPFRVSVHYVQLDPTTPGRASTHRYLRTAAFRF